MTEILTEAQQRVADRVLAEEGALRRHLVVSLTGAHAYGFPSPDSDLDLKAIHILPSARFFRLTGVELSSDRLETIDGVEVDYSSNELQQVLRGIVQGNGNFIERVLGALTLRSSPEHTELIPLVRGSISKRIHRHYRGFATGQFQEWENTQRASAKKLLYVLRTTLTGAHALSTGEMVTDVTRLLEPYGFEAAQELVERKRQGERIALSAAMSERWRTDIIRAFSVLDQALATSSLPEQPPNLAALEGWLLEVRRAHFDTS